MKRVLVGAVTLGFLIAGWAAIAQQRQAPPAMKQHTIVQPDQVRWASGAPPGLPPGAEHALLAGDPTKASLYTIRMRAPDGYVIKPHSHSRDEHITVLKGHFMVGMGDRIDQTAMTDVAAGGYITMPAGMHHYAMVRGGEAELQVTGNGPFDITYVNPNDDPRLPRSSR